MGRSWALKTRLCRTSQVGGTIVPLHFAGYERDVSADRLAHSGKMQWVRPEGRRVFERGPTNLQPAARVRRSLRRRADLGYVVVRACSLRG